MLQELSGPGIELLQTLHRIQGLTDALATLQQDWTVGPFTHGDLRLDNFVVFRRTGSRQVGLKVIDWESAEPGERCWDVGSVFAQYLGVWAASVPVSAWMSLRRAVELARYPLASVRPSIQAFWRCYSEHAEVEGHRSEEWLFRAIRMAAARLLQTALEEAQVAARLTTTALVYVQLANNLLREPETAAEQLLRLQPRGAMAP
jgi:aminoglycoside phosphotransferase (APT) family kinase protein